MPAFIRKTALHFYSKIFALNQNPHFPKTPFLGLNFFSSAAKSSSQNANPDVFMLNYLINAHGFSRASAMKASKLLYIKSTDKPDAVIALLKSFGLNDSHISSMFRKRPILLQFTKDNLVEKIEFFRSLGFSSYDILRVLSAVDVLLKSLKKQIIPSFDFIKNLLGSDSDMMEFIKRYPTILTSHRVLCGNVDILRGVGVPERNIAYMVRRNPRAILVSNDKFREAVVRVENFGFNPLTTTFVKGVWAWNGNKSSWDEKMEEYKRWGMSEDEVLATFRKYPWCMMTSVDKIRRVFEFFVNEMGCSYSIVMTRPPIVSLSIEKTIVPRCAVFRVLASKGLMKRSGLGKMLVCSEKLFLMSYVEIHKEEAHELLKVYHEKLGLSRKVDCNEG